MNYVQLAGVAGVTQWEFHQNCQLNRALNKGSETFSPAEALAFRIIWEQLDAFDHSYVPILNTSRKIPGC
jgi:hypothetical protein